MEVAVQQVREHGRRIITDELRRLHQRATLSDSDLAAVASMLDGVLDQLLVARLERLASHRPDLVPAAVELIDPSSIRLPR